MYTFFLKKLRLLASVSSLEIMKFLYSYNKSGLEGVPVVALVAYAFEYPSTLKPCKKFNCQHRSHA